MARVLYHATAPGSGTETIRRQARLVDGADEVHRMVLNRNLVAEGRDFWKWAVAGG